MATDSSVKLTHIPTGITALATEYRSQHKNKESALAMLKGKIFMGSAYPLPEVAVYTLPDDKTNPQDLTEFKEFKIMDQEDDLLDTKETRRIKMIEFTNEVLEKAAQACEKHGSNPEATVQTCAETIRGMKLVYFKD